MAEGSKVTVFWYRDTEAIQYGIGELHDADAAVQLALSVVVVGVRVVSGTGWGRRAAAVGGAAMLE